VAENRRVGDVPREPAETEPSSNNPLGPEEWRVEDILDAAGIDALLDDIAAAAIEHGVADPHLSVVGIRRRGDLLARRLQEKLTARLGRNVLCGSLDITLYRDDFDSLTEQLVVGATEIPFAVQGRTIVLVDDVLFTGRTVRAALEQILEFGRPARILLAVLLDRGWRELPISADIVGRSLVTERTDDVQVLLAEVDGRDAVLVRRRTVN